MRVEYALASESRSYVILIVVWETLLVSLVQGKAMDIGCGFMNLVGEALVLDFFIEISLMNAVARILLTSLPNSTIYSGSYGNSGNVLFFHCKGFSSSYS
jgi:hypothetical protein